MRTESGRLRARALEDAAGPGIDTVSVQAAANPAPNRRYSQEEEEEGLNKLYFLLESHNSPMSLYSKAAPG